MAYVSYPGVYVSEASSGVHPIAAVSTSTQAFLGEAETGPDDEAKRITNWTEFQKSYGGPIAGKYLAYSVYQFFNNGGQQCYIVRVLPSDAKAASSTVQNQAETPTAGLIFTAKSKGTDGNNLYLTIADGNNDSNNESSITITKKVNGSVVSSDGPYEVSMVLGANNYVETVVNQQSNFVGVEISSDNTAVVKGKHTGGDLSNFNPDTFGGQRQFQINVNNDGWQTIELEGTPTSTTTLDNIATEITTQVIDLTVQKTGTTDSSAFTAFTCVANDSNQLVLTSGVASESSSVYIQNALQNDAAVLLKLGTSNGGVSKDGIAVRLPANTGDDVQLVGGTNGTFPLNESDYDTHLSLLDNKTDFSLLAVPDMNTQIMFDNGVAYCEGRELQDVFYIGSTPQDKKDPDDAEQFRDSLTNPNSYGALYFPWIRAQDFSGNLTELPPAGYMAGLYARIDARRGVWKAPAGTEASLSGAVGLVTNLTDTQQGNLNKKNVDCIRQFTNAGLVSWGARTISTSTSEYNYVPVRRTAIMLRVSLYNGLQWAVFEPNDDDLWSQIRLNVNSFMMGLFRQGAFQGASPKQAFFVKCDSETTPQDQIDLGIVNVLVGFAALKPAEFVVVQISQMAGQAS